MSIDMAIQNHHTLIFITIAILLFAGFAGAARGQDDDLVEGAATDARWWDDVATVAYTGLVILTLVVVIGIPLAFAMGVFGGTAGNLQKMRRRYFETCRQRREDQERRPEPKSGE